MRFPWKYVQIDGQWFTESEDDKRPAEPASSLDALVGDEWQMGSIRPDENGKWMVHSFVS